MSHDDDFVTHLKSLERTTPSVSVDREHILSVGRRRRAVEPPGSRRSVSSPSWVW